MPKDVQPELIESTAGEVAAELLRRGIRADQRITITIEPAEPDDWITKARAYARRSMEEGWSKPISTASSRKSAEPCSLRTDEAGCRHQCLCQRRAEGNLLARPHDPADRRTAGPQKRRHGTGTL